MLSIKKTQWARLALIFLLISNATTNIAGASNSNAPLIYVTDYKNFRKINYSGNQLLIFKSTKEKGIYFLSNTNQISQIKIKDQENFSFKTTSKLNYYVVNFSKNKLILSVKSKGAYFLDSSENNSICSAIQSSIDRLNTREITKKISSINIEKMLDAKTCENTEKEMLLNVLQSTLKEKKSSLNTCMEKGKIKELAVKDLGFQGYIGSVYSKYLKLVDQVSDEKKPLKIICQINDPKKLGSFDASVEPNSISLNMDQLAKNYSNKPELEKAVQNTLNHEILHFGDQLPGLNNCLDEKYADLFTKLCDPSITVKNIPTSDQLEKICLDKSGLAKGNFLSTSSSDNTFVTNGTSVNTGTGASAINANNANNAQANLNRTVTEKDFTKVSDSNLSALLSNTNPRESDGQPYTVPSNSAFGQIVQNTMNSFSNSGNTLTTKLNAAIATSTNTAEARTNTLATSTSATTNSNSTYIPQSTANTATITNDTSSSSLANTNTRMPANISDNAANVSGTIGKTSLGSSVQPSELASGISSGTDANTFNTGAENLGNTNTKKTNSPDSFSTTTSSTSASSNSSSAKIKTAEQKQTEGSEIIKNIQSLKAFNTVTGGQYQEIKKYYSNPQFQNLLQTYDMRIMVKNLTGQYIAIGVDSKKAKKVFNDDGQILKTIEDKK